MFRKYFECGVVALICGMFVGCAANTHQAADQITPMVQPIQSANDQQQAALQPINQAVIVTPHPEGKKLVLDAKGYEERQPEEDNVFALNANGGGGRPDGVVNNYYTTIGNISMSAASDLGNDQAGTATGAATGTQTASQTPAATTDQRVDPNVTANVPIGIAAPGGVASPQATGTSGTAGDVVASQSVTAELQTVILEMQAQNDLIRQLLAGVTSRPAEVDDDGK